MTVLYMSEYLRSAIFNVLKFCSLKPDSKTTSPCHLLTALTNDTLQGNRVEYSRYAWMSELHSYGCKTSLWKYTLPFGSIDVPHEAADFYCSWNNKRRDCWES